MGKPFERELRSLESTYEYVQSLNLDVFKQNICKTLTKPLYIIGSGGSLSACYFAEMLHEKYGMMAKAITPLESYNLKKSFQRSNILIVSAGGRNKDILLAFDQALSTEPEVVISLCAAKDSPLSSKAKKFSISPTFEFPLPTGKDGFLASNSLLAFFTILARGYDFEIASSYITQKEIRLLEQEIDRFLCKIDINNSTFNVLYGGWAKPIAVDIESKLTEAALANSLLADFRNFGHGRHHWFDKKKKDSAIISLVTPDEEKLEEKTILQLPKDIPLLRIKTNKTEAAGSIELLIKSFYLIKQIGKLRGIDPGKPGVPGFGSKLYHLNYTSFYKKADKPGRTPYVQIQRKIDPENVADISKQDLKKWTNYFKKFTDRLHKTKFGGIVLDYDRTLCSDDNRLTGPSKELSNEIIKILQAGFLIGIVSGRGSSIKKDLRNCIPKKYWRNLYIGFYNGAEIASLADDKSPNRSEGEELVFVEIRRRLKEAGLDKHIDITQRAFQLTFECRNVNDWELAKPIIYQKSMTVRNGGFMILESSRSLDIVKRPEVSKLNMIEHLKSELRMLDLAEECLCIGDKGRWPGNDFELLNTPYSLSVNEVSSDPNTCWNLAPLGIRNTDACFLYLKAMVFKTKYFYLSIK
jgi:hydroxymethylpyrimidine pyrophosphatase-like HAD family hydrolase